MTEEIGFLYGFSNESMQKMLKVGVTKRSPIERLNEANRSYTWIPTQFKLELAKQVTDPFKKEKILHNILTMNGKRVSPDREFFRISVEELKLYFELMDGILWDADTDTDIIDEIKPSDIKQLFKDNDTIRIRNKNSGNILTGKYNYSTNSMKTDVPDTDASKSWCEWECELNNKWVQIVDDYCVNVTTRNLSKYFMHEQQIRHIIDYDIMELTFNSFTNTFVLIDEETKKPIHCGSLRRIVNIHNDIHNAKLNKYSLYWIDNESKNSGKFESKVDGKWIPVIDNIKYRIYGK